MRITVVTPSFNQAPFLEETITSVLTQDYKNVEYLVTDGGSTVGSLEIIRRYANKIFRGRSAQMADRPPQTPKDLGLRPVKYFWWQNSDDTLRPGALSKVVAFFRRYPECEVVSGGAVLIDERSSVCKSLVRPYTLGL